MTDPATGQGFGNESNKEPPPDSVNSQLGASNTVRMKLCILIMALSGFPTLCTAAEALPPIATNSLAFHLQSLGGTPTMAEREVIEAALSLMKRHQFSNVFPLRSIRRDGAAKEWVLVFDNYQPDAAFSLFLRDKDADWFEYQPAMLKSRRRFPPKRNKQ